MKKLYILFLLLGILFSCEDVIDLDLNETEPRLVIDAEISITKIDQTANAAVRLTTTAPFFDGQVPIVEDAQVIVTDDDGAVFEFEYTGKGFYQNTNLTPTLNKEYTLEVIYKNETYTATETLELVPSLNFVEQKNDGGFSGEDIELKAFFNDPIDKQNFYFFQVDKPNGAYLDAFSDEFFNGNEIFGFISDEEIKKSDEITFFLNGVDEKFYNFMFVLLQQSTDQSDGPFQTQPATVRGNIINQTTTSNFPLGYFRVSEVSILTYTVQ